MAKLRMKDPSTGGWVEISGGGGEFLGAQVESVQPAPRGVGDLWVDTSATVLEWDTAWKVPAMMNGWVNYGATHATVGYRKTAGGLVVLKGLLKNGTLNAEIFTLPPKYRPKEVLIISAPSNTSGGESGACQITEAGVVSARSGSGTGFFSLSGVTFFAEQ